MQNDDNYKYKCKVRSRYYPLFKTHIKGHRVLVAAFNSDHFVLKTACYICHECIDHCQNVLMF